MALSTNERQNKRKAALQQAAERDGFPNASAAMTAWMKGEFILIDKVAMESEISKVEKNTKEIADLINALYPKS
jgi:hypothetical protein